MTDPDDSLEGTVRKSEKDLGLPRGFVEGLKKEDDWSFIIKTHALLEAAISHLLTTTLGKAALADVFSRLELSDKSRGKMAFVGALDLLGKPDRRFINSLSELRNTLVHDVRRVGFSLSGHLATMDEKTLGEFAKNFDSFSASTGGLITFEGKQVLPIEVFRSAPKTAIWWSAMLTVAVIHFAKETQRLRVEFDDLPSKFVRGVVESPSHLINPDKG